MSFLNRTFGFRVLNTQRVMAFINRMLGAKVVQKMSRIERWNNGTMKECIEQPCLLALKFTGLLVGLHFEIGCVSIVGVIADSVINHT